MDTMKRQKDMTPKDESLGHKTSGGDRRANINSPSKNEAGGSKRKHCSTAECLVVKVKSDAVKNNIA